MKDQLIGVLIVAIVIAVLLGLMLAVDAALEGYVSPGWCNLSDGSCYPK
ncbi:hypothetical protein LCGC14_1841190 [marine sediment metagenome]|uniref:Uncharacterized protein n=1 Tax=marine sediment metagenome TaxID=412755 RepID=A0A0F9H1F1_9ZZZZ